MCMSDVLFPSTAPIVYKAIEARRGCFVIMTLLDPVWLTRTQCAESPDILRLPLPSGLLKLAKK